MVECLLPLQYIGEKKGGRRIPEKERPRAGMRLLMAEASVGELYSNPLYENSWHPTLQSQTIL